MHNLIWLIILFPPLMAYWLWQRLSSNSYFDVNAQRLRLGKHGYWVLLAVCYASFLGVALALHKI